MSGKVLLAIRDAFRRVWEQLRNHGQALEALQRELNEQRSALADLQRRLQGGEGEPDR
jgi:hypothetical protein